MTDGANADQTPPELTVSFVGEIYRPTSQLTFGRQADLSIDDNSYLHRRAGRFRLQGTTWWLENLGSRLRLTMVSADGSLLDLQPGASSPLLGDRGVISITAGPTRYAIEYDVHRRQKALQETNSFRISGADTMTYGPILTPRELDFVVVMAQGRLTGRLGPIPSHGEIAEIWGVSAKTVDNTLQRLRSKLRNQNINYVNSSETLIEYLVTQGLVSPADLEWACLDNPEGPRPAATRSP